MSDTIAFLQGALQHHRSMGELRAIIEGLLNEGYDKDRILNEFELFREDLEDDSYEDVVLDVMDFLTGWCSPHMLIEQKPEQFPIHLDHNVIEFCGNQGKALSHKGKPDLANGNTSKSLKSA